MNLKLHLPGDFALRTRWVLPLGEMEGGATDQASGDAHPSDGEGLGDPQRHGEEIHLR